MAASLWGLMLLLLACARTESTEPSRAQRVNAVAPAGAVTEAPVAEVPAPERAGPKDSAPTLGSAAAPEFTFLTTGGASALEPLPWILALHGLGDRPESFAGSFAGAPFRAHVVLPRGLSPHGGGFDWLGARVRGDPHALARGVDRATRALVRLLDRLAADERLRGEPVVTGFSQGGILSFALAVRHPERLRASLPIGGFLPPALWPERAPSRVVPILAFHGEADQVVPFAPTHELCSELAARGYELSLRSYPGLGHSMNAELGRDWFDALGAALAGEGAEQPGQTQQRAELGVAESFGESSPPRPGPRTQRAGSAREALPAPVSPD